MWFQAEFGHFYTILTDFDTEMAYQLAISSEVGAHVGWAHYRVYIRPLYPQA